MRSGRRLRRVFTPGHTDVRQTHHDSDRRRDTGEHGDEEPHNTVDSTQHGNNRTAVHDIIFHTPQASERSGYGSTNNIGRNNVKRASRCKRNSALGNTKASHD